MATKRTSSGAINANDMLDDLRNQLAGALLGGGGPKITEGEGLVYHDDPDNHKVFVPHGWSYQQIHDAINRAEREAETKTRWTRIFKYRFADGAYALMKVLKARYGGSVGESIMTMFGPEPPELQTIDISYGVTAQVPEGKMSLPALPGLSVFSHMSGDREYGQIYAVLAEGPRKYKDEVAGIFDDVQRMLETESIYRGQAVVGADKLDFVDLAGFSAKEIVFSTKATRLLDTTILGPLRAWRDLAAEGVPLKRAALLHGPYGTGKTSAGLIVAQEAVKAGWTALTARAGRDDIGDVLRTARLYQPAVVFVEDLDNESGKADDPQGVSRLLDAFDGAFAKGAKVMVVATTNFLDRVAKGLLRPGRFDAVIEIGKLDATGIVALVRAVVDGDKLAGDVDWDAVTEAMDGFYPAFVREAVDRARIVAVTSQGRGYVLDTDALVRAAESVQEQLRVLEGASEGESTPDLDTAFRNAVVASLTDRPVKVQGPHQDAYMVRSGSEFDDGSPHYNSRRFNEAIGQ